MTTKPSTDNRVDTAIRLQAERGWSDRQTYAWVTWAVFRDIVLRDRVIWAEIAAASLMFAVWRIVEAL